MMPTCANTGNNIGSVAMDQAAFERLQLFDQAAGLLPVGAWSCDLATEHLQWTSGVFDMFGLSSERTPDRRGTVELYSEESRELLTRKRSRAIETGTGFSLDAQILAADGRERWIRITAGVRRSNGRSVALFGMKQDITEDYLRWTQLRALAECDPLTGVANRARFQRFLELAPGAPELLGIGALLLFDLDRFKSVNDWWGHSAGDACLITFAERLKVAFPGAHLISRIGGDEFAVLLPPVASRSATMAAVRARLAALLPPVPWNTQLLPIGASVGIAFSVPGADPQALFIAADRALYDAKASDSTDLVCAA
jgi:diguanylate cyclase (GGDEF)-like protein/PAS domain S-box-containing protein